jgi:hypothetical protein
VAAAAAAAAAAAVVMGAVAGSGMPLASGYQVHLHQVQARECFHMFNVQERNLVALCDQVLSHVEHS